MRYWHLDEDSQARDASDPQKQELIEKMDLVDRQRKELLEEIDVFLNSALAGEVRIRDEKVKLYKKPQRYLSGRCQSLRGSGEQISNE